MTDGWPIDLTGELTQLRNASCQHLRREAGGTLRPAFGIYAHAAAGREATNQDRGSRFQGGLENRTDSRPEIGSYTAWDPNTYLHLIITYDLQAKILMCFCGGEHSVIRSLTVAVRLRNRARQQAATR